MEYGTSYKDVMLVVLAGMRQECVVSLQNACDDPSYEESYFTLTSYVEHVRDSRQYGITLKEIKNMHNYLELLVKNKSNNLEINIGNHQSNNLN